MVISVSLVQKLKFVDPKMYLRSSHQEREGVVSNEWLGRVPGGRGRQESYVAQFPNSETKVDAFSHKGQLDPQGGEIGDAVPKPSVGALAGVGVDVTCAVGGSIKGGDGTVVVGSGIALGFKDGEGPAVEGDAISNAGGEDSTGKSVGE